MKKAICVGINNYPGTSNDPHSNTRLFEPFQSVPVPGPTPQPQPSPGCVPGLVRQVTRLFKNG